MWQARLAWIGRRPADAEIQKRMAAIAAAGGKAIYLQADATDRLGMAAAVSEAKQQLGQINGVIHTAAVFQDRLLRNMNASDLEHVLAAKVSGAVNLHHALAAEPLDFLGFFSSAAALMDSGGQGNYAAANTFMDAYAAYLRRAGIPVTLINWGYWGSVGAVANGYHRRLLAAEGIGSIEPEMGFHAVERALAAGVEQVLVIEAKPAGLAHFGIGPGPAAKIDRSLGGIAADESLPTLEPSHPEKRQPGLPQISHSGAVTYLQRILAEVLKFQEQELDAHSTFDQFGVDSVVSVAVVARLERDLGPLPSTLLFEEMTLDLLAKRLIQDRGAELLAVLAPSMPGPPIAKPELPAPFAGEPAQRASGEDIAVIGVTGRYPGAPNLECLWRNLAAGGSSISEVPGHRWDWRRYADARQGPQSYLRWGGFIDGVDMFDAAFFGILPRDAVNIDPQERLFLEACWDLLEQTGYHGLSHEPDTGVFAGLMYGTYGEMAAQLWQQGELSGGHSAYWSVANRVSYTFDLHGPSFAVDSACSSSLTAVHLACESIRRGDCRMAIAGGVNLILHPAHLASLGARNMLAPDGKAKVFDAGANGYVPGEGVGAVLLKPLPDALADGDDIWAVIKGSALNAGGKTSGYTVPNPKAQADLVETALRRANIDPRTITYIEAHGTGTELGDPIEISGLTRAFAVKERAGFCSIGSIKSNIGHLEGAAGIAGLTKLLLQIRNRKLAPTVNLASLNPKIESLNASFKPQRELAQWPQLRLDLGEGALTWPRRAGVSSFGAGGANVHVIVEEWLGTQPARAVPEQPSDQEHLFLLSAPTQEQLLAYAEAVAVFLSSAPPELRLENLAFSSQVGRQALKKRLAVIARSLLAVAEALRAFTRREETVGLIQTNHTERAGSGVESATSGAQLPEQQDLRSLARRWTQGEAVDWRLLWSAASPRRASFPGLPLDRKRYWINAPAHSKQLLSTVDSTTGRAGGGTMVERQARLEFERTAWEPASLGKQFRSVRMALLAVEDPVLRSAIARALIQRGISHLIAEGEGKQLVEQLAGRDSLPDAVIHIGAGHVHSAGVYPEIGNAFHTVLQLAVNILARQPKQGLRLLCARVERDGQEQPHLAALAAVIKTLAQEHCGCTGSCLALALSPPDTLAMQIVDELCGGEEFEAAYRHGLRMSKKAVAFTPPAPATNYVARDGMYLITGGAGALGLHFAGLLVERGAGEIVLIGRSGLGDGIATRIADLGRGANIRYEQADVASQKEIDALVGKLRRGNKPVRGVIHAAGVIRDAAAVHKTREQIDAVLAPKLAGTLALDHATAADPLDFFVLFSSVVGWSGNRGQVDYAYSNCFLDAFAETREHWRAEGFRSGKTLSIGWPLWRNGGMKVDDAVVKFLEQRWGMTPMTTESGLLAFESLLAGADASASVIEKVAGSALSTAAALRDSFVGENPSSTQGTQSPTAAFDIRPIITAKLCELAAGFLLVDTSEVDIHAPLLELGFDSISMSEMVAAINKAYGLELLPAVLFECPDLEKLVEYIACRHGAVVEGRVHPAPEKQGIVPAVSSAIKPEPTSLGSKSIHTTAAGGESDIAVIGMAGLLPGSANLEEFWRHLAAGDNLIGPVPADREELIRDRQTRNLRGGFIEGVAEFDAELFGIAPREAALMDPQQRLFLQAAWSAIADAGYKATDFEGTQTGVFAGVSTSDYNDLMTSKGIVMEAHMATGLAHAILANRVSHLFGLQGPSETVDTACSSSLVAVHHAVRALRSGECETAIAGGVSVLLTPGLFVAFTKSGMLSPDGLCKTFDNDANGYVRGEGAGVVILKRLDCALLDGDHIYALIKGSAVNHCGRAASLTAPNPRAQAELLKAAYADGGIAASTISYLEAHGTGTRLGDLVEIEGLRAVFGAGEAASLILGSVKTNIGHLEAAAGIAGLLKVLLAVFHGQLPPHLHLRKINSHIKLQGSPFVIHDQLRPWPSLPVRRAGVSSFGFGGTNAHVVIEDPPVVEQHSGLKGPLVLVVSAPDAHRLATYARSLADRLASDSRLDLSSVAYSLQTGREEFSERLAVVADDPRDVITALRAGAQNQAAAGLYRGVAAFSAPWLPTRDDHKLASLWVQGAKIDWLSLWSGKPRRTSLPTFPLAKTRHWFAASANGLPAAKELAQSPGLLPLGAAGMSVQTDRPAVVGGGPDLGGIIRAELAEILHIHATEIAADHTFQKLGLDSIFAMDLAEKLSATLGREVQAALLYEYNTIELLTGFLGQAGKAGAETSGGAATAAAPLPDASASPAKAEAIQRTATEVLAAVLAKVVGRPLNLQHSFTENGFSSLDMLRAVNKLEEDTGALPKTLLFDQPDIASLTDYLCAKYGVDTVLKLESLEQESDVAKRTAPLPVTQLANNGPSILAKHLVQEDASLSRVIGDLARVYGVESGFAGRDIAPLLFLSASRRGYLEFSQYHNAVLVWSYTGPPQAFVGLVEEFAIYARSRELQINVLSPTRIEEIAGGPSTTTPFGVVQQIENLDEFSLHGQKMGRLRGMVHRFTRSGQCAVREYASGSDPAVDQQIVSLIDRWAARKSEVSPYISSLREDLRQGRIAPEHRVFLTTVAGVLRAAVIITRMASEPGYLLDTEFYGDDMPMGGLEYTIVQIIHVLRAEGIKVFSFGATFGIKVCDSPNTSPEAEQALQELRSVGVLGTGNYRFKNKFRPQELPIYLCQPADGKTDVSVVLLMIAGAYEAPQAAKSQPEQPALPSSAATNRDGLLETVHWNPLRLAHSEIEMDLLTDSWAERTDTWIMDRIRLLAALHSKPATTAETINEWWLPFVLALPTPSGRSAEALLCRAWPGRRGRVLHNGLFPTWDLNLAEQRFTPVALPGLDQGESSFSPDVCVHALKNALAERKNPLSFIVFELSNNASGGHPVRLAQLRRVRELAEVHDVPLVLDASRILENAVALTEIEPEQKGRDPWMVVRELLSLADAATFSLSKDFGVSFGGLVTSRRAELNERLLEQVELRGTDVSLSSRRILQTVLSDHSGVLEQVRQRMATVRTLWQRLSDGGLPVTQPVGGHCVLLDIAAMPAFTGFSHPVASCLAWLYRHTGIRGGPHLAARAAYPTLQHCIRLAVPIGMIAEAAEQAAGSLVQLFQNGPEPEDLRLITDPSRGPKAAGYRPKERVMAAMDARRENWLAQQLQELGATFMSDCYTPSNQNLDVIREIAPNVDCRLVTVPEGEVEVFTIGTGPTLLLMHPFNIGAGVYAPQMAGLSGRFRLIVIHQPGVGRTRVRGNLSLEGIVNLQRRVLFAMGINEPIHVAGSSVGAIFAQYYALRFPERTVSLSIIGGSYRFANRKGQIDRLEQVIVEDFDLVVLGTREARIAKDRERLTRLLLRCESMDPRTGLHYLELFAKEPELTQRLREISVPTLILQGRYDSVVGHVTGRFLHKTIPGSRYLELPQSGHFICFTDPDAVNRALDAFLQEVGHTAAGRQQTEDPRGTHEEFLRSTAMARQE
jgi:acyl transferase domain-containing protein/tryptophanase/pimeloyl-ACP methyl ester carboxylesterase/NAD(P)-dependent dehydrogenase (short-subunit alcohol dehydrogenase family)